MKRKKSRVRGKFGLALSGLWRMRLTTKRRMAGRIVHQMRVVEKRLSRGYNDSNYPRVNAIDPGDEMRRKEAIRQLAVGKGGTPMGGLRLADNAPHQIIG